MVKTEDIYNSQITAVVHGFVQVWNKFEGTLSKELSQIQGKLQGMHPGRGEAQPNANSELFYRACTGIYPHGSISMGSFSSALGVPLSTATRIADWLFDRGYIQRMPDPDDRRVVKIALTETGQELYKAIDRYMRQRLLQILSSLTEEERTTLLTLIGKVVAKLKEAAG
jgi:DNA-binding MarR family transcriptional regulator